jgi:tripartite-type tricarboxylate transporter receptor subunit TctC
MSEGSMLRRIVQTVTLSVIIAWHMGTPAANAQTFPTSTVTIVVPFPPGGGTDLIARGLADELGKLWKQSVLVENVGGANSIIGTNRVVKSRPDGYTLLLTVDSTVVHNRFLFKNMPFDPDKSLMPVTMVASSGQLVIANNSFPANNLKELIEVARNTPGGITYGSTGVGTQPHLLFETMAAKDGLKFVHVVYKGIGPIVAAVMSGEVKISTASPASAGAQLEAGAIKALAIGGLRRSAKFPNVPTIAESGFKNMDATTWWGMFAPAGTDPALVERINHDVVSVAKKQEFVDKYMNNVGVDPVLNTPAEFNAAIKADVDLVAEMVKVAGVKPQD